MKRMFTAGALAAAFALTGAVTAGADPATISPDGYKGLHFGQTAAQGEATGLLTSKQVNGACTRYYLKPSEGRENVGGGVWFDRDRGLVLLSGTERTHTPEGITMGSTLDQVRQAYPGVRPLPPPEDYVYTVEIPGHPGLQYRFAVDEQQRVRDYDVNADDLRAC